MALRGALIAVLAASAVTAAELTVPPGGLVSWPGDGVTECGAFSRRFQPVGGRCYYPVDLLEPSGQVVLRRWRGGELEEVSVTIAGYPYPQQELTVEDSKVNLSEADRARAARERKRLAALWTRTGPVRFTLPLGAPLDPLPTGRSFGRRRVFNGQPRSPHTGVDFSGAVGTPVQSAAAGTVVLADDLFFAGNSVLVDHGGGLITMYMHLDTVGVAEGETVDRGQIVGTVGATGRVTGPHLHFGVRWHGLRIDPMPLLGVSEVPELAP
jgi:murein DD-endopeptidase MepM/ murein hydrolase activator NlpD